VVFLLSRAAARNNLFARPVVALDQHGSGLPAHPFRTFVEPEGQDDLNSIGGPHDRLSIACLVLLLDFLSRVLGARNERSD
jgi:hypothetical protein